MTLRSLSSMAGSPRALTRLISRTLRCCWASWRDNVVSTTVRQTPCSACARQPVAAGGPSWTATAGSVGDIRSPKVFAVRDLGHRFAGRPSCAGPCKPIPKRHDSDEVHLRGYLQQGLDGILLLGRSETDETGPQTLRPRHELHLL